MKNRLVLPKLLLFDQCTRSSKTNSLLPLLSVAISDFAVFCVLEASATELSRFSAALRETAIAVQLVSEELESPASRAILPGESARPRSRPRRRRHRRESRAGEPSAALWHEARGPTASVKAREPGHRALRRSRRDARVRPTCASGRRGLVLA